MQRSLFYVRHAPVGRAFCFLREPGGLDDVFLHRREIVPGHPAPRAGDYLFAEASRDAAGRLVALDAVPLAVMVERLSNSLAPEP